ncbi:hypothetical protein E1180_03080 [Roseibium denhamense]|uniref:4Fe-4S ferredoxin-type domain-containing protein n=1 Tax=Roseibium denhamense TaxID=76305 RepID=A0ABY1PA64_9HYPH|nr:hypothetical protein [Roseibium denhamense]MTI04501.1 hypothetical protein [Roseibium denhamense]SMP28711.1 hypothetical protein SAMN06265374_2979 [Roseibium denhamense]
MNEPAAARLITDLTAAGFSVMGTFSPSEGDGLPPLPDGRKATSVWLIGSTGPSLWPVFIQSSEYTDGNPDPMDRYTKRVIGTLSKAHGLDSLYPFEGPPYFPFQQWAIRCGGFSQSPLGVLAHEDFGPWAGFRAALLSAAPQDEANQRKKTGPCPTCTAKPCLTICPVGAISLSGGYDVLACRDYLAAHPAADCWTGCLARKACPHGPDHAPEAANAQFHMQSFLSI